jgi:hypothetical protein
MCATPRLAEPNASQDSRCLLAATSAFITVWERATDAPRAREAFYLNWTAPCTRAAPSHDTDVGARVVHRCYPRPALPIAVVVCHLTPPGRSWVGTHAGAGHANRLPSTARFSKSVEPSDSGPTCLGSRPLASPETRIIQRYKPRFPAEFIAHFGTCVRDHCFCLRSRVLCGRGNHLAGPLFS